MTSEPTTAQYLIIDEEDSSTIAQSAPTKEGAGKLAQELALSRGRTMHVYEKVGRMVPVQTARWEGPGD